MVRRFDVYLLEELKDLPAYSTHLRPPDRDGGGLLGHDSQNKSIHYETAKRNCPLPEQTTILNIYHQFSAHDDLLSQSRP